MLTVLYSFIPSLDYFKHKRHLNYYYFFWSLNYYVTMYVSNLQFVIYYYKNPLLFACELIQFFFFCESIGILFTGIFFLNNEFGSMLDEW